MDVNTTTDQLVAFICNFVSNNWTLILMICGAYIAGKLLKAGIQLVVSLLIVGVLLSVLTNMGVLPPMDQIIEGLKSLVSKGG